MTEKEISDRKKMDGNRGERAKDAARRPRWQAMWGILVLLSLIILLLAGIFAVGSRKGWDDGRDGTRGDAPKEGWRGVEAGIGDTAVDGGQTKESAGGAGEDAWEAGKRENLEMAGGERKPEGDGQAGTGTVSEDGGSDGTEPEPEGDGRIGTGMPSEDGGSDGAKMLLEDGKAEEPNEPGTAPENGGQAETPPEDGKAEEPNEPGTAPENGGQAETPPDGQDDPDAPAIALTFDDGPYAAVTNRIVDVLLEYGATATFFVVGDRIDTYSDTLKRVYESGFEVASHTWSHKNLNKLSKKKILKELDDTKERLARYIPVGDVVLVRPPYGNANEKVRGAAGVPLINWSVDSEDWKSRDAQTIVKQVLSTVKDGDVVLMHDLYESTAEAVEILVPELVAQGYKIVSVSELFSRKGVPLEKGILYRNPWDSY